MRPRDPPLSSGCSPVIEPTHMNLNMSQKDLKKGKVNIHVKALISKYTDPTWQNALAKDKSKDTPSQHSLYWYCVLNGEYYLFPSRRTLSSPGCTTTSVNHGMIIINLDGLYNLRLNHQPRCAALTFCLAKSSTASSRKALRRPIKRTPGAPKFDQVPQNSNGLSWVSEMLRAVWGWFLL